MSIPNFNPCCSYVILISFSPFFTLTPINASATSKYSTSSTVAVDYTQIKNLKKINGLSGNNVTYTNQKTMYIDPDYSKLSSETLYYKNK